MMVMRLAMTLVMMMLMMMLMAMMMFMTIKMRMMMMMLAMMTMMGLLRGCSLLSVHERAMCGVEVQSLEDKSIEDEVFSGTVPRTTITSLMAMMRTAATVMQ